MSLLKPPRTSRITENTDQIVVPHQGLDPDDHLYRSTGQAYRDLGGNTLKRAQELCVSLYRGNPIANRLINIYRSYLAGDGFSLSSTTPEVNAVLEEFWTAPRSRLSQYHGGYARDWLIFGEAFHPVTADEMGNTTAGFIDPTTVTGLRRDPRNNMLLTQILLRQQGFDEEALDIVTINTDLNSSRVGLYEGDAHAWLFDRIGASTRGTPFLLPVLDWLDAYDQTLWEMLERQKAIRAHFWDVKVAGGKTEVEQAMELFGTDAPRTGSVRFHTDAMEVNAVAPSLGASEDVASSRYVLRHVAAGGAVPPHWLGEPEDANRSTAEQMEGPTLRTLVDVQAEWQRNILELASFAVDAKVAAGMLPAVVDVYDEAGNPTGEKVPARDTIEVIVPEIAGKDVETAAASLAQVAQAFTQLDLLGAVGPDTVRKVVRQLLPALGVNAEDLPDEDATNREMQGTLDDVAGEARESAYDSLLGRLIP